MLLPPRGLRLLGVVVQAEALGAAEATVVAAVAAAREGRPQQVQDLRRHRRTSYEISAAKHASALRRLGRPRALAGVASATLSESLALEMVMNGVAARCGDGPSGRGGNAPPWRER